MTTSQLQFAHKIWLRGELHVDKHSQTAAPVCPQAEPAVQIHPKRNTSLEQSVQLRKCGEGKKKIKKLFTAYIFTHTNQLFRTVAITLSRSRTRNCVLQRSHTTEGLHNHWWTKTWPTLSAEDVINTSLWWQVCNWSSGLTVNPLILLTGSNYKLLAFGMLMLTIYTSIST